MYNYNFNAMGSLNVTKLSTPEEKAQYTHQLIRDLEALDFMIENDLIEKEPIRIGAEQEFCLVDNSFLPKSNSLSVLEKINDEHFTTEIGKYNLEINLDPLELKTDCFSKLHKQLNNLLEKAKTEGEKEATRIVLTGILPTLGLKHISEDYMTEVKRYAVLNEAIKESRIQDFDIHVKGVDELNMLSKSVMLEACNTSFQTHLQINPDEFIEKYNWAQAIAGPVLSICANSPIAFGKELWAETRIALFTQSVDTRTNSFVLNEKQSRVSFGDSWETGSVSDIFKDNISKFRSLVTSEYIKDSVEMLENGEIPKLKALNLHNGTVYRWNRVCYGVGGGKPHLRIECRYIPSGPTASDEIANMMFWVGLMVGQPKAYKNINEKMDFKDAKANFFKSARYGMSAQFYWNNKEVTSRDLVLDELLPMAYRGLYDVGISPKDAEHYLGIIENRVKTNGGAQWMVKSYRNLQKNKKPFEALQVMTSYMYEKQEHDYPVDGWRVLNQTASSNFNIQRTVKHNMSTKILSIDEDDSLELVYNIMLWKNIHHMPVINTNKELVGVLSWTDLKKLKQDSKQLKETIKNVMQTKLITTTQEQNLDEAVKLMEAHKINSLPVINNKKLIGIITSKDI